VDEQPQNERGELEDDTREPVLPEPDEEIVDTLQEGEDPDLQREKYKDALWSGEDA
jgi:hypothetical protein